MVILRGDAALLAEAKRLIEAKPHPEHLRECEAVTGERKGILALLDDSLARSSAVGGAVRDGEAMLGGVMLYGYVKYQIWLLTTREAGRFPRWMLGDARAFLEKADRFIGTGCSFYQVVPESYRRGIRFAERLGFRKTGGMRGEDGRTALAVLERDIYVPPTDPLVYA